MYMYMTDIYIDICISMCINICFLMSICMCKYMYLNVYVFALLLNYGMNVINIVQRGSIYKYFISTSAFFQSSCGKVHIAKNYCYLVYR